MSKLPDIIFKSLAGMLGSVLILSIASLLISPPAAIICGIAFAILLPSSILVLVGMAFLNECNYTPILRDMKGVEEIISWQLVNLNYYQKNLSSEAYQKILKEEGITKNSSIENILEVSKKFHEYKLDTTHRNKYRIHYRYINEKGVKVSL